MGDTWNCKIGLNGSVIINYTPYPYIFWEAYIEPEKIKSMKKLGAIMFERTNEHVLRNVIRKYLNNIETDEFMRFWISEMASQHKKYVKVEFVSQESFEREFPLEIITNGSVVAPLRVEYVFTYHDDMVEMPPLPDNMYERVQPVGDQVLVVEWGGMIIDD